VPIGEYTRIVIDKMAASGEYGPNFKARVLANIVSEEPNVKGIVAKVLLGEADAGICYASDAAAAGRRRLTVFDIPDAVNVIADYPIAVMATCRNRALAQEFLAFMLAPKGQQSLAENGFIPVSPLPKGK
jgi:molybdate transport system substrate-binding protein